MTAMPGFSVGDWTANSGRFACESGEHLARDFEQGLTAVSFSFSYTRFYLIPTLVLW